MNKEVLVSRFNMIEETTKEILGNIREGDYLSASFLLGGLNVICQACQADLENMTDSELDWYKADSR